MERNRALSNSRIQFPGMDVMQEVQSPVSDQVFARDKKCIESAIQNPGMNSAITRYIGYNLARLSLESSPHIFA